jgi:putative transposase
LTRATEAWRIKKSKFTEQQIAFALQGGTQVAEACRKMGISEATFYRWRQLYGGLLPSEVKKLRQVRGEALGPIRDTGWKSLRRCYPNRVRRNGGGAIRLTALIALYFFGMTPAFPIVPG